MQTTYLALGAFLLVAAPVAAGPQEKGKSEIIGGLDLKDSNLVDVVEFLRKQHKQNIVLGRNAEGKPIEKMWPPLTVTVQLDEVPFEQALRLVCESARCLVEKRPDNVWYVYQPPEVTIQMERAGTRTGGVRMDFRSLVFDMAAQADANIVLGNDVPDGLMLSIRLRNVPWPHAIRAVTKAAGLQLVIVGNDLTVGGPLTASRGTPAFTDLPVIVTIQQKNAAVRDLAAMIAKAARVKVVVAEGVSKDLKINLALRDVTHRVALEKLARAAGLRLSQDPKRAAWRLAPAPSKPKK